MNGSYGNGWAVDDRNKKPDVAVEKMIQTALDIKTMLVKDQDPLRADIGELLRFLQNEGKKFDIKIGSGHDQIAISERLEETYELLNENVLQKQDDRNLLHDLQPLLNALCRHTGKSEESYQAGGQSAAL